MLHRVRNTNCSNKKFSNQGLLDIDFNQDTAVLHHTDCRLHAPKSNALNEAVKEDAWIWAIISIPHTFTIWAWTNRIYCGLSIEQILLHLLQGCFNWQILCAPPRLNSRWCSMSCCCLSIPLASVQMTGLMRSLFWGNGSIKQIVYPIFWSWNCDFCL